MSRKAFFSPKAVLQFFTADDPAIGVGPDDRGEALAQYARTLNVDHLQLRPDVEPTRFYVRVLSAEQRRSVQALIANDELDGLVKSLQSDVGSALTNELLQSNLVGLRNFTLVTGVLDDGRLVRSRIDVPIGQALPADVHEALDGDFGFKFSLLLFLLTAGQLTEDEKKP